MLVVSRGEPPPRAPPALAAFVEGHEEREWGAGERLWIFEEDEAGAGGEGGGGHGGESTENPPSSPSVATPSPPKSGSLFARLATNGSVGSAGGSGGGGSGDDSPFVPLHGMGLGSQRDLLALDAAAAANGGMGAVRGMGAVLRRDSTRVFLGRRRGGGGGKRCIRTRCNGPSRRNCLRTVDTLAAAASPPVRSRRCRS